MLCQHGDTVRTQTRYVCPYQTQIQADSFASGKMCVCKNRRAAMCLTLQCNQLPVSKLFKAFCSAYFSNTNVNKKMDLQKDIGTLFTQSPTQFTWEPHLSPAEQFLI